MTKLERAHAKRFGLGRLKGVRVLIAEDEWIVADNLSVLAEEEGAWVVGPCARTASALTELEAQCVDFAVVDMRLLDGFADMLVSELVHRGIPFMVLTAFEALPTNADRHSVAYLNKPIDKETFIGTIERNCIRAA